MPGQHQQSYAPASGQIELDRLVLLSQMYDPASINFLAQAGIAPGMRVADLGCGPGFFTAEIAKMVGPAGEVIGVDFSKERLDTALQHANGLGLHNVQFVQSRIEDLIFAVESFDAIHARLLFMHVNEAQERLAALAPLLKPGGKFLIEEPTGLASITFSPPTTWQALFMRMAELQFAHKGTDPAIGAKVPTILQGLGFQEISSQLHVAPLDTREKRQLLTAAAHTLRPLLVGELAAMEASEMTELELALYAFERDIETQATYFDLAQVAGTKS